MNITRLAPKEQCQGPYRGPLSLIEHYLGVDGDDPLPLCSVNG